MTSSKFSKHQRIQQPPPVCKKPYPPPPPPYLGKVTIFAEWRGECSDGEYRELIANISFEEKFTGETFVFHKEIPFGTGFITITFDFNSEQRSIVDVTWTESWYYAYGWLYFFCPLKGPFVFGPEPASGTDPYEKLCMIRVTVS